jgi:putative addiction module component (TIGR02574 family)
MRTRLVAILAQAMQLPPAERADLADRLWLSVNSREEVDAAWEAEIQRRVAELDAGEAECIPFETVIATMREKIKKAERQPR